MRFSQSTFRDHSLMRCSRRGFTLVELLVVIGIVSLLITILMPALSRARQAAVRVTCASNQRQVLLAAFQYANDNRQTFPKTDPTWLYRIKTAADQPVGIGLLVHKGYLKTTDGQVMFCPDAQPMYNWCQPRHSALAVTNNVSSNTEAYSTYVGKFCSDFLHDQGGAFPNRSRLMTNGAQSAARLSPILIVCRAWDPHDLRRGATNLADAGSIPGHEGKGLNAGFHDGSVRWIPADEVELLPGEAGKYKMESPSNNFWKWAKHAFGKK